ncbi:MAG: aminoacyl-tRNA hydrolase [Gammaproteobacteria bacterium]|nr:aminoacyl-tRNA hydrolase [Gammaproteobacteria bacterium]
MVGLGNPGKDYAHTRHNAGFWLLERFAQHHQTSFAYEKKFQGELARCAWQGRELWLLKPQTFMNLSGQSVHALAQFYKIALANILVVHDELDLPTGVVRLKQAGGAGGHNGLRDIIERCGGNEFLRLRIGIGHPGDKQNVTDHVLNKASKADEALIYSAIDRALQVLPQVIGGELQKAMHTLHSDTE